MIVSETDKRISILELTAPNNTPDGLINARHRKQHKQEYLSLAEDISRSDWTVTYDTIEIGSLGHYSKDSLESIKSVLPSFNDYLIPDKLHWKLKILFILLVK